jgi:hypothetical protein
MPRSSTITAAIIQKICDSIRLSGSIATGLMATRITMKTYQGWALKVDRGGGTRLQQKLVRDVRKTSAAFKLNVERMLRSSDNWRAHAWWLERKYSNEYGKPLPQPPQPDPEARAGKPKYSRTMWVEVRRPESSEDKARREAAKQEQVPADGNRTQEPGDAPSVETSQDRSPKAGERPALAWVPVTDFEALALKPIAGRLLSAADDSCDEPVAGVITDSYWARAFGRSPKVIGRKIRIHEIRVTIVGVTSWDHSQPGEEPIAELMMPDGAVPLFRGRKKKAA